MNPRYFALTGALTGLSIIPLSILLISLQMELGWLGGIAGLAGKTLYSFHLVPYSILSELLEIMGVLERQGAGAWVVIPEYWFIGLVNTVFWVVLYGWLGYLIGKWFCKKGGANSSSSAPEA